MGTFSAKDVIEAALKIEQRGNLFYKSLSRDHKRKEIREVFQHLAWEEKHHLYDFQRLAKHLAQSPDKLDRNDHILYLENLLDNLVFKKLEERAIELDSELEAADLAIEFEKDTILFYIDLYSFVSSEEHEIINRIIASEKDHLCRLFSLKHRLMDAKIRHTDRMLTEGML